MPSPPKPKTHQLRNEAQLNCVALRSSLHYEVAWTPVKGRDERQKPAPLTSLHATGRSVVDVGQKKNKEGRHVGLDFYDLLIEALKVPQKANEKRKVVKSPLATVET